MQVQGMALPGSPGVHPAPTEQGTTQQAGAARQPTASQRAAVPVAGTIWDSTSGTRLLCRITVHAAIGTEQLLLQLLCFKLSFTARVACREVEQRRSSGSTWQVYGFRCYQTAHACHQGAEQSAVEVKVNVHHAALLSLQLKLCGRSNKLSQTLLPACNPDGLTLLDWPADAQPSSSSPNSINWQFGLLLLNATHVGPTGFPPAVQPVRHVARCCIFDRQNNRFLGNVHTIPASQAKAHRGLGSLGSFWTWDSAGPQGCAGAAADGTLSDLISQQPPRLDPIRPGELVGASSTPGGVGAAVAAAGEAFVAAVGGSLGDEQSGGLGGANACVVRCAELAADPVSGVRKLAGERLSLYVELNVAFRLMAEDADVVPQDESKVSRLHAVKTGCRVLGSCLP